MLQYSLLVTTLSCLTLLSGCATPPPRDAEDLCAIFEENDHWYDAAKATREKWGAPEHVTMAIMYQESGFRHDAAPPMEYFLGFIPTGRASSAYGYAQAKTMTWDQYAAETGNSWSNRENFDDAMDFVGWYIYKSNHLNKVSKWDAKAQYLNYHEGWGGYKRGSYQQKAWLLNVANKVNQRAGRYSQQYQACKAELEDNGWLNWF